MNRARLDTPLGMLLCALAAVALRAQSIPARTYANPLDLPYRFRLEAPSRREAADPTMVTFRGAYYLFASKSGGYWRSIDLAHWQLIVPEGLPLEDYAPTAVVYKDRVYFTAFNSKALYSTDDPARGIWRRDADLEPYGDPDLFVDDDGRFYLYSGCSSKTPLAVAELDPAHQFKVLRSALIQESRDTGHRGFEVPGDNNDQPAKGTWVEGAWMVKHDGKYYLEYAAAQTQDRSYADGLLVGQNAFGPFHYAPYSPVSYKPTGFIDGAGHGSTFQDLQGRWWHIATMAVAVRHSYERRLGLFPVSFTRDGQMLQDNYLADFPHWLDQDRSLTGWMLLSLRKAATASSSLPGHEPQLAFDEDVRTWFAASSGNPGEWLQVDLGHNALVNSVQINFADEGSTTLGPLHESYRYRLEGSRDAQHWQMLVDHSTSGRDAPDDYEALEVPLQIRYLRLTNVYTPAGAVFSISGLRVFGTASVPLPAAVENTRIVRDGSDLRHAAIAWKPARGADFYVVRYGIAPDRLGNSYEVLSGTTLEIRSLNAGVNYFYEVDAVNEHGIARGKVVAAE